MQNVLQFDKAGRRKSFGHVAAEYPATLAHIVKFSTINDGPIGADGEPEVRPLRTEEMASAAVAIAAQFCAGLICARAKLERETGTPKDKGLPLFFSEAIGRVNGFMLDKFGDYTIGAKPRQLAMLQNIEHPLAGAVFDALRLELNADTAGKFDEKAFWRDVFLGMADVDPSGVVGAAGRLVFLDHTDEFDVALRYEIGMSELKRSNDNVTRH